ncbi:MAG: UDP-N-acetylmuramoyl-L-alanine--D-glutamate ligase [Bdellovibrionales bacterium]
MKFTDVSELKDKKILVVGLARTGVSLAHFLAKSGAIVTVSDHKSKAELANYLELMEDIKVTFELGGHTPKVFLSQDMIILSPGISPNLKIFEYARSQGVQVTGEFEFCSQFVKKPIIALTGTNGKTTVAHLIGLFLTESGVKNWVGGNYGAPLSDYLLKPDDAQVLVCEISSFMLEQVESFNPKNIVFTNLAENHLDRYRNMEEYVNAKRKIFLNTNQNTTSILNADDSAVVELARDPAVQRGRIFYFSRKQALEPQIMNIGGAVALKDKIHIRTGPEIEYYSIANMKMRGTHSVENIMAAMLAAREHGAKHDAIQKVIDSFNGMPHRLEYVRKVGGVEFFNDSKATNVHAVKRALDVFDENIILIMGGKDTNLTYTPLIDAISKKVKNLILVGEAKERINRDLGDFSETFLIGTFEEAVLISFQKSRIGDKVLLSPGCSSFDMFESYVERGNYFKEIINKFK